MLSVIRQCFLTFLKNRNIHLHEGFVYVFRGSTGILEPTKDIRLGIFV